MLARLKALASLDPAAARALTPACARRRRLVAVERQVPASRQPGRGGCYDDRADVFDVRVAISLRVALSPCGSLSRPTIRRRVLCFVARNWPCRRIKIRQLTHPAARAAGRRQRLRPGQATPSAHIRIDRAIGRGGMGEVYGRAIEQCRGRSSCGSDFGDQTIGRGFAEASSPLRSVIRTVCVPKRTRSPGSQSSRWSSCPVVSRTSE